MADPIRMIDAFRAFKNLPHQIAAAELLDDSLTVEQREQFQELFRADPPEKPEASPTPGADWLTPCRAIVREFEGCRLEAYKCPAGVWTIGWGHTGPDAQPGLVWTQQQADVALDAELTNFRAAAVKLLPMLPRWPAHQQAALVSFTYNVGTGALEESTLRKRLLAGEDPVTVVREELPRWNKGGGGVLPGLERRRAAEVALFCGGPPEKPEPSPSPGKPASSVLLQVPYEFQNDNGPTGYRECFSSSCAMVARFYGKVANDDEYSRIRARFGDTTDSGAQLRALGSLGLQAAFRQNGDAATLERLIREGRPVPVGWLHKGPVSKPSGGGHWSVVVGFTADAFIHNDPNGEADMVNGNYVTTKGTAGRGIAYSRRNWLRRWEADGKGSGWYLDVRG